MAGTGRELRRRIKSVQNTRKITKTMELVSTSKMKRAQDRVAAARPYAAALREVIGDLLTPELVERFPLLRQPLPPAKGGPRRAAVVLITSNRGLAGPFNANLIKEARRQLDLLREAGLEPELHSLGKKGTGFFRFIGETIAAARSDIGDKPTAAHADEVATPMIRAFEAGELASVTIVQAEFRSALSTPPKAVRLLPVEAQAGGAAGRSYILKPGADEIVGALLPLYVRNMVFSALVETASAEHAARRIAMKNATDNAGELISLLTRTYNRQRQASITQEIAEIVGGAAALAG